MFGLVFVGIGIVMILCVVCGVKGVSSFWLLINVVVICFVVGFVYL